MTSFATHNPIDVPVILTGETENLLIDKLFSVYRGLTRRSIVIKMTTEYKDNSDTLDYLLDELHNNYGHILAYVKRLTTKDKEVIEDIAKNIYDRLRLGDSSFKELRRHLSLSLSMFKHFYKYFIGFSESEIDNKVNKVIEFISGEAAENQLNKIGDTIDYVEEVIEFISSVIKSENKDGNVLMGRNYKALISKIDYKPSDKIGKLLRKFFWKRYTNSSNKSTNLSFTPGVLITNPFVGLSDDEKKAIIQTDKDRLIDLTDEELKIWADVLKVRYNTETVQRIVDTLRNDRLERIINLKISEPEPEPELNIPF
jgi:hypothetical protein